MKTLAALLLLGLLPACAAPRPAPPPAAPPAAAVQPVPAALLQEDPFDAHYKVHCDNVSGTTVCVMTGNALRPFTPRYPMLALGAVSEVDKGGRQSFLLRAVYVGEGKPLAIGGGPSLRLSLDGQPVEFSGQGSLGSRYAGADGKAYEVALYEVTREVLARIAAAGAVSVSVRGDFPLEKSFGPVNKLYFQQFVKFYVDKPPAVGR